MTYEKWVEKYFDDLIDNWAETGTTLSFDTFCNEKFRIYEDNNND